MPGARHSHSRFRASPGRGTAPGRAAAGPAPVASRGFGDAPGRVLGNPAPVLNVLVVAATVLTGALLLHPRVAGARLWRATMTPLASIIGSGFLVLGPVLDASYGVYAPAAMVLLCLAAYGFGEAIRFNIARLAATAGKRSTAEHRLDLAASWALAFAYVISVAYYLNLFGAFAVSLTPADDGFHARLATSGVFVVILAAGWRYGFGALERMEKLSVGIKLSIIAGLLVGLAWYFADRAGAGALVFTPPAVTGWPAVTLGFGLIVTVQGFETSRYLAADYDARMRIRSMRLAQGLSTAIYLVYAALLSYVFPRGALQLSETAIIDLMRIVAPVLPALLVAAALSAQFSAAVADTSGSGGLVSELTGGRISARLGYAILGAAGLVLTWGLNVFEIISYASRAFAAYYALQAAIAAIGLWHSRRTRLGTAGCLVLALLGLMMALLGTPVE